MKIPEPDQKLQLLELRDDIVDSPLTVALNRAQTYTRVWQENEGLSFQLKKAKALREYFNTVPLFLRDNDAIAGNICEVPGGHPIYPEIGIGENGIFVGENPEFLGYLKEKVPTEIHEYWMDRNLWGKHRAWMREVAGVDQKWSEVAQYKHISLQGHLSPSYNELLEIGIGGIIGKIKQRSAEETHPAKREFLSAAETTTTGLSEWIGRYGDYLISAAKAAQAVERERELIEMAEIAQKVKTAPPDTFREALQLIWFVHQAVHIEGHGYSCTPGRLDQLLWPYLKRDLENGSINESVAFRLCANLVLKQKDNTFWGPRHNMTQGLVVSGSDTEGRDQTNLLSWYFIAAASLVSVPEPLVWIRWHPNIDPEFFDYCLENIGGSTCFPLMMSDTVVPEMFMGLGVSRDDSFEYVPVGCNEIGIPGKCYFNPGAHVNYLAALEQAITAGKGFSGRSGASRVSLPEPDQYKNFDELAGTISAILREQIDESYKAGLDMLRAQIEWGKSPLTSCFFDGCVEEGHDLIEGTKYNTMTVGGSNFANMVDSLAAIRDVVFEKREATLSEVVTACDNDFEGYEALRQKLLAAPKHGNDEESIADIIDLVQNMRDEPVGAICRDIRDGTTYGSSHVVRSGAVRGGLVTPATPDGRRAGTPLASSVGASVGAEKKGPTAFINSLVRLTPARSWRGGYNVNMRFQSSMLKNPEKRATVAALLRSFFERGGQEMQINSVDPEVLLDAQKHPEAHSDLVVRVAGFSEFFTRLAPELQADIMSREEHSL